MHSRRLATLLVGAWLAASLLVDVVAVQNFRGVDRFLSAPSPVAAQQIAALGKEGARNFLRMEVGERNRSLFEQWEWTQLVLGLALLAVIGFSRAAFPSPALFLVICMLCIGIIDRLFLTPQVTNLGRLLEYPDHAGIDPASFWRLHGIYSGLEILKLLLGLTLAGSLLARFLDRDKLTREYSEIPRPETRLKQTTVSLP